MPSAVATSPGVDTLEPAVQEIGRALACRLPAPRRTPAALADRSLMRLLMEDPALRAAIFRFVDVRPACRDDGDVSRHLAELLGEVRERPPARAAARAARLPLSRAVTARAASLAVRRMARRFIAGRDVHAAVADLEHLWRDGVAASVDLLGEATVTEAEADRYAARCRDALHALHAAALHWPQRAALERDGAGRLPRVNLSVKVSALTPLVRPHAPGRTIAGAEARLRELLRTARDLDAHLHIDMESADTREAVLGIALDLLSEPEFAEGPSAGIVLQAYLEESPEHLDEILRWVDATPRATPLTVRLVKGAYWDHEVVQARQHGWRPPVFTDRRSCDRSYERLTRTLIDHFPAVRLAVASHNLRSIAHAAAYAQLRGLDDGDVEFQVLRGLGDDAQAALAGLGRRVRCYSPVGDLVAGMAYLVRRLLENTSNDSFLSAHAQGQSIATLLEAP